MKAGRNCLDLIKRFEGLRLKAYRCPAGVWTIGYGHTGNVQPFDVINELQAEIYLQDDLRPCEDTLNLLKLQLNQNQFDALCSFIYNVGSGNFMKSTLLKKIKAGDPLAGDELLKWTKVGGVELPGLVARRKAEYQLYNS